MLSKTKKWLLALIAILTVICMTLALAACDPDDGDDGGDDPTPLATPTLAWQDEAAGVLSWNSVDHATAYIVYENGTALSTMVQAPTTTYTIGEKDPGVYNYQVAATSSDSAYKTSEKSNTITHTVNVPNPTISVNTWGEFDAEDLLQLSIAAKGSVTIDLDDVDAGNYYVAVTDDLNAEGFAAVSVTVKVGEADYDLSTVAQPAKITIVEGTQSISISNNGNQAITIYVVMFNYFEATPLATPANFDISGRVLSWDSVDGADYYNVYYSEDDSTWEIITTVTEETYTHLGNENGTYYYKVSAASNEAWLYSESVATASKSVTINATPLAAPEIELVGNAINWNSIDHADGYSIYLVVDGDDDELVDTISSSITSYTVAEAGKYYVVATTTSTSYSNSQASVEVAYGGSDTQLIVGGSVDVVHGNYENDYYSKIELADSVDLNKYYKVSVRVNNNSSVAGDVLSTNSSYPGSITIIGRAATYGNDEGNDEVMIYTVGSYNDGTAHYSNGVFSAEVAIWENAIVIFCYYESEVTLGITVTLEEGTLGDYEPPQGGGDDEDDLLMLNWFVNTTIPANGELAKVTLAWDVPYYKQYRIIVYVMDGVDEGVVLEIKLQNTELLLGESPVTLTHDESAYEGVFQNSEGALYLSTNLSSTLTVSVWLYATDEEGGDVGEGELAKGHDVTVTTDSDGEATIPYASGVGSGVKMYTVKIMINDVSLEELGNYSIAIRNDEGDGETMVYDADTGFFTADFMPFGDNMYIVVTYKRAGAEVTITVSLVDDDEGGGDDDEGGEIYSGWETTITLAWNTPEYTMTVYGAGTYKFGLSSEWDNVVITIGENELTFDGDGFATLYLEEGSYTISIMYFGVESARVNFMWDTPDSPSWNNFPGEIEDDDDEGEEYPELMRGLSESVTELGPYENVIYTFTGDVDSGNTYKIVITNYSGNSIDALWVYVMEDEYTQNQVTFTQTADGYEATFELAYESQIMLKFVNFDSFDADFTITIEYVA